MKIVRSKFTYRHLTIDIQFEPIYLRFGEQADNDPDHDAPDAGYGGEPHVGHLVERQVGERLGGPDHCGRGIVEPGLGASLNADRLLGGPGGAVVVLGQLGHGLTEAHPHREDQGAESANKRALYR